MAVDYSRVREELHGRVLKMLFQDGSGGKDMTTYIKETLMSKDLKFKVQNVIYQSMLQETNRRLVLKPSVSETIRSITEEWREKTCDAIETMVSKSGTLLTKRREPSEKQVMEEHWGELGSLSAHKIMTKVDPLYAPNDMYNFITSRLKRVGSTPCTVDAASSSSTAPGRLNLASFCLELPCMSREELCAELRELHPSVAQADLVVNARCKMLDGIAGGGAEGRASRVIESGLNPLAPQACKTGCPHGQRFTLWCMSLGIDVSRCQDHLESFSKLKNSVLESGSLLDGILLSDVSLCISDSDSYFVFEDMAYQIALAFVRDPDTGVFPEKDSFEGNGSEPSRTVAQSSCSFVPCHGVSCFIAPLCYLHNDVHMVYVIFKALYNRYFSPLLSLSDHPSSILYLCVVFERLFEERSPLLLLHFSKHGIDPVQLVFKWLFYGFAGYLETDQLLYLWDRVVGFDSLVFFPLLAAAILELRTPCLTLATCSEQAEKMLSDLHHISVLPLLQAQLFL